MQQQTNNLVSSNALYSKIILLVFVLMCAVKRSNSFDYFKEKPSFMKSCKLSQPDLTKCSTEAIQKIVKEIMKEDVNITTLIKTDLFGRDGYTFYNVTKVQNDINIGKLKAKFDNLFGGRNKDLERSILTSINENWREFFEVLRPSTTNVTNQITFDLLHKICLRIPAKYFLEDIPTPKQFHENISSNTL
ncbi:hypothetical protein GQX74_006709 [Glossina fuscipes]|nr:hypothetical protein GQX74_006709 [Glossina fuscipes]